jgi:uncharacterized DUF497 family protein
VKITFDPRKRDWTLRERGIDFASAGEVFHNRHIDVPDDRHDYGEKRIRTIGFYGRRMVMMVSRDGASEVRQEEGDVCIGS